MAAAASLPQVAPEPAEQRMLLHGVSWKDYVLMRELFDGPGLRMTYLKGRLELMSPSPEHELWKKNIARFIELYCHLTGVPLHAYGSTTFKRELTERGAEPDECYLVGHPLRDYPEIVVEVIHKAPLLNKLEVYAGMGIAEAWIFQDGTFSIWLLDDASAEYRLTERSVLVPGLDFEAVAQYVVRVDTPDALREFASELGF